MASESVVSKENSDLTARETARSVENIKVYTRKFRRRARLENGDGPATTSTAEPSPAVASVVAEPIFSGSPAKSLICDDVDVQTPLEALIFKDGNPSHQPEEKPSQPLASVSEIEAGSENVHVTGEDKDGPGDALEDDDRRLPSDDQATSSGLKLNAEHEPNPIIQPELEKISGGDHVSQQLQAPEGQEQASTDREELPPSLDNGTLSERQPLADVGEQPPSTSSQEGTPNGGEVPQPICPQEMISNHADVGEELPSRSCQEGAPTGGKVPQHIGEEVSSNRRDVGEELHSRSNREGPPNGAEVPQPFGPQELSSNCRDVEEEFPSRRIQEVAPNGGAVPQAIVPQEITLNSEDLEHRGRSDIQAETSNVHSRTVPQNGREELENGREEQVRRSDGISHISSSDRQVNDGAGAALMNGKPLVARVEDRIRINLSESTSRDDIIGVKRKLEDELVQVRNLVRKLEAKELRSTAYNTSNANHNASYIGGVSSFGAYNQPQLMRVHSDLGSAVGRTQLMRVNSEVGSVGHQETRPFRHLTVSVMSNHGIGEFVEKEKRTPKANQYYRNSEFLLGKDRLPPENKRVKPNGTGKKHGLESEREFGFGIGFDKNRDKVFKNCSNLLQRLMKHKHGWVFNEPVDAQKLCIPDYHDIIKHPMDFSTIKTRLSQNWYKSPREFAEDVRLVFRNAMTYNPQGQDVHTMAEELSKIFEERWTSIEKEYYPYHMYYDAGLPIPTPRRAPPPLPAPVFSPVPAPARSAPPIRTFDRSESMTMAVDSKLKQNFPPSRTPAPKKPKAKDPNKRDMTYEEKQKLSTNLQSLPVEKLDAIVQIIKKRNTALSQHDDEIEVDIDSVDAETLWELDRFVTNYRKSLSKNKRKAELALRAAQAVPMMNAALASGNAQKEGGIGVNTDPSPVQVEKQGDNVSVSSSSSSSSSDSGSSSSDSDTDSSSAYGSDAGRSPKN